MVLTDSTDSLKVPPRKLQPAALQHNAKHRNDDDMPDEIKRRKVTKEKGIHGSKPAKA